jgi:predicted porin
MSLGMMHNFSKSTLVYAAYVATSEEVSATVNDDQSTIALGLRVGF